jgi:hypothetical protein
MRKFQLIFGSAVLALSMISTTSLPMAAYGQAGTGGEPGTARPRMHRMLGVEAPWISIALRHQKELSLNPDQVANLEKIRTLYRDQSAPIQEQLRATERDNRVLQETPANLISQAQNRAGRKAPLPTPLPACGGARNGKSILTAQQRDQLKNLVSSRHPGFKSRKASPPSPSSLAKTKERFYPRPPSPLSLSPDNGGEGRVRESSRGAAAFHSLCELPFP